MRSRELKKAERGNVSGKEETEGEVREGCRERSTKNGKKKISSNR